MKLSIEFLNNLHLKMLSSVFMEHFSFWPGMGGGGRGLQHPGRFHWLFWPKNLIFRSRIPRYIDKNIFPEKKQELSLLCTSIPGFGGWGEGVYQGVYRWIGMCCCKYTLVLICYSSPLVLLFDPCFPFFKITKFRFELTQQSNRYDSISHVVQEPIYQEFHPVSWSIDYTSIRLIRRLAQQWRLPQTPQIWQATIFC